MPSTRLPSAAGATLHDAGHDWDAIRVPRSVGLAALAILGTRCNAAIEDPLTAAGCVYYFVPAGTADTWDVENTTALGHGSALVIPPARRTEGPGPHWRVCPGDDGWLTDPDALAAAVADAFGPRIGEEKKAMRALLDHSQTCEPCVDDHTRCPTGLALVRAVREARR
ncbi:hypothetical protein [Streptomyces griseofuscus]|uniref:hypothetical protein n=1 Tax=Streptomyces griseofuscus TaxID=146922 RepID=UPI0036C875F2